MTIYPNILWFVELFLKCQRTSCTDTIDESITPYCLDYTTSTRLYETQILFGKRQVSSHNMESVGENMLRGPARILHNETMVHNITGEDSHEHSTTSTDEDWFLMFLAAIVGMICCWHMRFVCFKWSACGAVIFVSGETWHLRKHRLFIKDEYYISTQDNGGQCWKHFFQRIAR
jgi:hypothetical protein